MGPLCSHTIEGASSTGYGRVGAPLVWIFPPRQHSKLASNFTSQSPIMSNALTVKEKEHWKDRIERRIEKQIEARCSDKPGFMDGIHEAARKRALESLGVARLQSRLDQIQRQEESLDAKQTRTQKEMIAILRGIPVRQVTKDLWRFKEDIESAVSKRQLVHEDELLAETDRGREILNLRTEKENLLDTVWLATSPKQIKDLWEKVDELLGGPQTSLQREALAMDPIEED